MDKKKLTAIGAMALVWALPAGTAHADETHNHSDNGPRWSLISIGQVDDPAEDVLEHAAIFGATSVVD
ncbi:hypothetical protein [Streptomyces zagrosensis]|uniref:Uncharacterized protein n=1 Tax=Streptomyces zagrosensis TaxID=1042984 RepID=A0A7W9QCP0_9ACTN|nr:hypothetical protein [Streptomyces zagrosensis]MBB5937838.1 hypothetical protein [Streptomyces zagrosensis]